MPRSPMSLEELFSGAGEASPIHIPVYAAQQDELLICLNQITDREDKDFVRGDFVQHKHLCGVLKNDLRGRIAYMYWRVLDWEWDKRLLEAQQPNEVLAIPDPDCVIAYICNGSLMFEVGQTSMLRRVAGPKAGA